MCKEDMEWIMCPDCNSKTRVQVLKNTVLENFPLFCPKCKHQHLVTVRDGKIKQILPCDM